MSHMFEIPARMLAKCQSAAHRKDTGEGAGREEMISVAAYYRAEHRGFKGDDSLADWLGAEAEIDALLKDRENYKARMRGR